MSPPVDTLMMWEQGHRYSRVLYSRERIYLSF
jgi:hypothetical protein